MEFELSEIYKLIMIPYMKRANPTVIFVEAPMSRKSVEHLSDRCDCFVDNFILFIV
jgi:hypothetical protein